MMSFFAVHVFIEFSIEYFSNSVIIEWGKLGGGGLFPQGLPAQCLWSCLRRAGPSAAAGSTEGLGRDAVKVSPVSVLEIVCVRGGKRPWKQCRGEW